MAAFPAGAQLVPTTEAANQTFLIALNNQQCQINIYTKSINVPIQPPGTTILSPAAPPQYQNINPVFIDLYVSGSLIIGGVLLLNASLVVRDLYLGFSGDLVVYDTTGAGADPYGVPPVLPPMDLRNWWQRNVPLWLGGRAPPNVAGRIPGMGSRFILVYLPPGTYTPGYPP
jgi:hypothetical protein